MADYADVHSLDAIRDVRAALCTFAEDAKTGLDDVEFAIRRTVEWVTNEQRLHWQSEIKRWQQRLAEAKAELARKRLSKFMDREPDTSVEEKKVKACEHRLDEAHRKLDLCKKWVPELQHAVQEYRGSSQPLASQVDVDIPRSVARLDRMIDAIERYTQLRAPTAPRPASVAAGSTGEIGATDSMARPTPAAIEPTPAPAASPSDAMTEGHEPAAPGDSGHERQRGLE